MKNYYQYQQKIMEKMVLDCRVKNLVSCYNGIVTNGRGYEQCSLADRINLALHLVAALLIAFVSHSYLFDYQLLKLKYNEEN